MIHHGDLFDVLPTLDAESIDACVTDPPYELNFMNRKWDDTGVAFRVGTWREIMRVLKPGAHLVAFGGTRTSHRMVCAIEDAGFEIRDSLCWLHGQGFPKSLDVSKAIDKAAGEQRDRAVRKKAGSAPRTRNTYAQDAWTKANSNTRLDDTPLTAAAAAWVGYGTALKPAYEPIVLARKPFSGSVAENVQRHGTAALNIDACRIEGLKPEMAPSGGTRHGDPNWRTSGATNTGEQTDIGRWPANVLLDEEAAAMLDEQTGELVSGDKSAGVYEHSGRRGGFMGEHVPRIQATDVPGDRGGASRFYYVAKPSREERDFGTEQLTARQRDESRKEGNPGGDNPRNRGLQPRGNFHPTVKPVELMRWLVRLVTPPDGVVLDPFMGSGTTGMACAYEHRRFVGIEREADYIRIAEARIAAVAPLFGEVSA